MIQRADFISAVRALIGTPVVHMGRVPGEGLDCGGVPWCAANACGANLPATRRYSAWPSAAELEDALSEFCDRTTDRDSAHVLQVYFGRQARHIMVPVGGGLAVHAWGKRKR